MGEKSKEEFSVTISTNFVFFVIQLLIVVLLLNFLCLIKIISKNL